MRNHLLGAVAMLPLLFAGCVRHTPPVDKTHPYTAGQTAAKDRVEARGRYDVNHNPNDTMSINSMGSD
jgi:PBP1b-binding outer membrane lipoprotein LpoB